MIPCTFAFNTHQLKCYKNFSILPNKKSLFYVLISVTVKWILCKLLIKHHLCKRFYNRDNPCMSSGPTAGQLKSIKLGKLINTDLNFCSWHSAIYRNFPLNFGCVNFFWNAVSSADLPGTAKIERFHKISRPGN